MKSEFEESRYKEISDRLDVKIDKAKSEIESYKIYREYQDRLDFREQQNKIQDREELIFFMCLALPVLFVIFGLAYGIIEKLWL